MTNHFFDPTEDDEFDDPHSGRISPVKVIILLFLVLVLVAITALPIIRQSINYYNRPPTPTPYFLQEA